MKLKDLYKQLQQIVENNPDLWHNEVLYDDGYHLETIETITIKSNQIILM